MADLHRADLFGPDLKHRFPEASICKLLRDRRRRIFLGHASGSVLLGAVPTLPATLALSVLTLFLAVPILVSDAGPEVLERREDLFSGR